MITTVTTNRNQNVGYAIINHLKQMGVYGKVNLTVIHTERNCSTRTKTTLVEFEPK
jgi:hypothetical protein